MTTLGALLGPEQPRTVADLVRMREAARPYSDDAEPAAAVPSVPAESTDDEPEPVEARPGPVAVAEPRGVESPNRHSISGGARR